MTQNIRVSDERHKQIKIEAATKGMTIEAYVEEKLS